MAELNESLHTLETLDLITLKKRDPDLEYAFKHIFTQESIYNSLLLSERREIHRAIAEAIETANPQPSDDAVLLLAHHFELGDDKEKALKYLKEAISRARKVFANYEALDLSQQALDLLTLDDDKLRWEILSQREQILDRLGDRSAQYADLEMLKSLAERLQHQEKEAIVYNRLANYYDKISQYKAASTAAKKGVEMATAAKNRALEAHSLNMLALAAWRRFNYSKVKQYANRALTALQFAGEPTEQTTSLLHLGKASYRLGEYDSALDYIKAALELTHHTDNKDSEANCNLILGWIYQRLGMYDKSAEQYQLKLEIREIIGDRYGTATALSHLGWVAYDQQHYKEGQSFCQRAVEISREINDRENEAYALSGLGLSAEGMGDLAQAESYYKQALAIHREINAQTLAMFDLSRLALLALQANNPDQAYVYGEEVITWTTQYGAEQFWDPWLIYYANYKVLKANNQTERANGVLEEAYRLLQTRANRISDATFKTCFLNTVKVNRQITEAWQKGL